MSKTSGLGDELFVGGYQMSGDVQSVDNISCPAAVLDVTGINKHAYERIIGLRDGAMEITTFFNAATDQQHAVLSALPETDVHLMYCRGTDLGNPAACMVGKQVNYDGTRGSDSALTFKVSAQANAYGLEWGEQLTSGLRTDTAATNGTAVDFTDGDPFILLPGSSGNTITTPDAAGLDVTGDIDIAAKIAPDDWTPAGDSYVISKYTVTGNQRSYALVLTTTGTLALQWSADGTTSITKNSTANLSALTNGSTKWVRATLDVDNGAAGNTVTFYTSDDGTTWTQLGSTVVTAGTTSIFASTAILEIGSRNAGTSDFFAGKFFEGWVKNGLAGTAVARPIATSSGVSDSTPLTWTLNGTATASNLTYGLQAYLQVTAFTGTDVTIKLQHSADNGVNDPFSDITSGAFTQVTAAPTTERIALTSSTGIKRYVRAVTATSGGFTSCSFVAALVRNEGEVLF